MYIVEYRDYENNVTNRKKNSTPVTIPVRHANDYPWFEITKSVQSTLKRPDINPSDLQYGLQGKQRLDQPTDDEYDFTNIKSTTMKIHSPHIINALRHIIPYYPTMSFSSETLTIDSPYAPVVQYWEELIAYKSNHPKTHDESYIAECNEHIDCMLGFIEQDLGSSVAQERELWNRTPPVATCENVWMLMKPGEIVVVKEDGEFRATILDNCETKKLSNGSIGHYVLRVW
jgi:hypothetical protein